MTTLDKSKADLAARESGRDAGLTRGIGVFAFAFAIVNAVVGAGIFSLPADMAHAAGSESIVAYVICAVVMGAVVLCCAEAGSRVPTSGGLYGYIDAAFGPFWGFIGGVLLWLSCVLAAGGIAAALGDSLGKLVPGLNGPWARAAVIVSVMAVLTLINAVGVKPASRVIGLATALKLIPLVLFVGVGLFYLDPGKLQAGAPPDSSGVGRAVILSLFAFQGMETALGASGEVANPAKTLPRALIAAMVGVTVLYVSIQVVCQGLLGAALPGSSTPLAAAFARIDPRLGFLMLAAAAVSRTVWLGSDALGAPRILFAFARDGYLPPFLGRVSKTHTPVNAIVVHVAIAVGLALTGTFEQLAVLSVLAGCGLYLGACAAAWRLRRRNVALVGTPLSLPALSLWSLLGIGSMVAVIALAKPGEIKAFFGAVAVSALIYLVVWLLRRGARKA